jgi:hypothetical protein
MIVADVAADLCGRIDRLVDPIPYAGLMRTARRTVPCTTPRRRSTLGR